MGPKNIKWWKCKDEMMVEYRERVRRKYEELDEEKEAVDSEWRQYKDAFVGVAEERCGRTSGKEAESKDGGRKRWRRQWGEKRKTWKMIEGIRDRGEQPPTGLRHLYDQKKKAARRVVDRARRTMEEELHRKLDEDGGKKDYIQHGTR